MKILILVQSIDLPNKQHYAKLRKAQEDTWDSIPHPDVDVIYYTPGLIADKLEGNKLHITCPTHWTYMFFNLAKAMRHMLKHDQSWDYIFKADNSVYIDKARLHEILLNKPREKYFGGMIFKFKGPNDPRPDFMWGDGYALSRDMVAYIVDKYNKAPFKGKQEDDVVVAHLMTDVANWDTTLEICIPGMQNGRVDPNYHAYRTRMDHTRQSPASTTYVEINEIIENDIIMMHAIHKIITNGKTNSERLLQEQDQN